jgi:Glyoxalase/Bleomycin resistance protein/Dioxygenase superfamily
MADGFIWYELVTNDMDKAVNFYKKVVGWDVKDASMSGFTYMIFGKDGISADSTSAQHLSLYNGTPARVERRFSSPLVVMWSAAASVFRHAFNFSFPAHISFESCSRD